MRVMRFLGNAAAVVYFIGIMLWVLPGLLIGMIGLLMEINTVRNSGFIRINIGISLVVVFGIFIGLSLLIPFLRKMYVKAPWMFLYVKIFLMNIVILTIAFSILNYGHEVHNQLRHTLFFILMLAQIIGCRILMSLYFRKKKVQHLGGDSIE